MFVQMELSEETFHLVKNTPKITGFLGGTNPTPVRRRRSPTINSQMTEGAIKPKPRISFDEGENVRVIDGPVRQLLRHRRRSEAREAEGARGVVASSAAPRRSSWTSRRSKKPNVIARSRAPSSSKSSSLAFLRNWSNKPLLRCVMKKVTGLIKLQVPAGKANPSPPVGPALGQHGVNIMEFCKSFNARTQAQAKDDLIIPVVITVYNDRSFTFITKTPPAAILLKKAAGMTKKGSGRAQQEQGRQGDQEAGARHRAAEAAGPQHHEPRVGDAHHRRRRPLDGPRGRCLGKARIGAQVEERLERSKKEERHMAAGKKYQDAAAKVDREKRYSSRRPSRSCRR